MHFGAKLGRLALLAPLDGAEVGFVQADNPAFDLLSGILPKELLLVMNPEDNIESLIEV